jgi:hypothetical protein
VEPVMRLAESCDLSGIVRERLHLPTDKGANAAGKVATVVAGMVAAADSIDDLDAMRHGGMRQLFGAVYAPSTLSSFLRMFSHGHVRRLRQEPPELSPPARVERLIFPAEPRSTCLRYAPQTGSHGRIRRVTVRPPDGAGYGPIACP